MIKTAIVIATLLAATSAHARECNYVASQQKFVCDREVDQSNYHKYNSTGRDKSDYNYYRDGQIGQERERRQQEEMKRSFGLK